LKRLQRM